jgi:hypothetical protein
MISAKISDAVWKDRSLCRIWVTTAGYAGQRGEIVERMAPEWADPAGCGMPAQ